MSPRRTQNHDTRTQMPSTESKIILAGALSRPTCPVSFRQTLWKTSIRNPPQCCWRAVLLHLGTLGRARMFFLAHAPSAYSTQKMHIQGRLRASHAKVLGSHRRARLAADKGYYDSMCCVPYPAIHYTQLVLIANNDLARLVARVAISKATSKHIPPGGSSSQTRTTP